MVRSVLKQITSDMRREISGVILIALGILGYLSLIFPSSGILGRDLGRGLVYLFGLCGWVVPSVVILTGALRLYNHPHSPNKYTRPRPKSRPKIPLDGKINDK